MISPFVSSWGGFQSFADFLCLPSRIVAYTVLQYPWSIKPLPTELKAALLDPNNLPVLPDRAKADGFVEFMKAIRVTEHFDYDPEKDFRTWFTNLHSLSYCHCHLCWRQRIHAPFPHD
jgi:hypothetical protein